MRDQPSISPRALKVATFLAMLWAVGISLLCLLDPWRLPPKESREALIGRLRAVAHEEFTARRAAQERVEALALQLLSEQRENAGLRRTMNEWLTRAQADSGKLADPDPTATDSLNDLRGRVGQ